jgi:threonyl-tRNA synthetase
MNCPSHAVLFGASRKSYRDLPLRLADFGRLHRYERSGATSGLTRVRSFCQDDAHIFCRESQIGAEIAVQLAMVQEVMGHFGFGVRVKLSTRPEHSIGREPEVADDDRRQWDAIWQDAEGHLRAALEQASLDYHVDEGDGAFYGPKIDCEVQDALGRWHQLSTVQLDFSMPRRFDLKYFDEDSAPKRPVMVHRAVLGSLERFFGVLIEHCAGDFPLWLAPEQVRVITLNDDLLPLGEEVRAALAARGLRVALDGSSDKLGAKVRLAELDKVPVVAVLGRQEAQNRSVALRWRKNSRGQQSLPLDQAILAVVQAAVVPGPSDALLARKRSQAGES